MKFGLEPIGDRRTEVLILGTFPGEESLKLQQYYANEQNCLWRILSDICGDDFRELEYSGRLLLLKKHRIGLWDVLRSCERVGSSDSKIRNPKLNDFAKLKKAWPLVRAVLFNGKKPARYGRSIETMGFETQILPSTSSAHAIQYAKKLTSWQQAFEGISI